MSEPEASEGRAQDLLPSDPTVPSPADPSHDPQPEDRRRAERFRLRDVRATLMWEGEGGAVAREAKVLNISGGGTALLCGDSPRVGQVVRLRLYGESIAMEPIEATVLATSTDLSGERLVRMRFARWTPLDVLLEKHRERRLWERYPASESHAGLSWSEGGTGRTSHGQLLNISGGGAGFTSDNLPPPGIPIWLRLQTVTTPMDPIDPVECRLVATSLDPSGMRVAHLQFVTPCPMDLFQRAVNGPA